MVKIGSSTKLFAGVGLAVPRLGNVRLRLHFLRRGTSRGLLSLAGKELIVPMQNIEGDFELNIEELASGVYFIKVQLSDNSTVTKRFIKQ